MDKILVKIIKKKKEIINIRMKEDLTDPIDI
jgi:hypothetical protein